MTTSVIVHLRDGSKREFPHQGRPGGSYTNSVRYEGQFAIVRDPWDNDTAFPMDVVERVEVRRDGY